MCMGLLSSMQDIVSKTNQFMNSFHVSIPTGKVGEIFGIEDIEINSLSDLAGAVQEAGSIVALGYNMASCAMNASTWTGLIESLSFGISAAMMDIAQNISSAISAQIRAAFQQIMGTLLNLVMSVMNLFSSIMLLWESFKKLGDWADVSLKSLNFAKDRQNCVDMMSSIAACYLNKFLGPILDEFESDVIDSINEFGNSLNNKISEELEDTQILTDYINRESFLLKKASIQISGLTPENVLRYSKD